jgi:hypothetical protein
MEWKQMVNSPGYPGAVLHGDAPAWPMTVS